jgi:hypothetical protein
MARIDEAVDLQHINAKFFVDGGPAVDPARYIEIFHRWIQDQALEELLIDVADYRHVPNGPGVILVALEADYSMDNTGGRLGLRYNRKAPLAGSGEDRIRQALRSAAKACLLLETELAEEGPLKFSRQQLELLVNDRALAPNTPETYAACQEELQTCLATVLGHHEFTLQHDSDPRRCFGVHIQAAQPFDLTAISQRL